MPRFTLELSDRMYEAMLQMAKGAQSSNRHVIEDGIHVISEIKRYYDQGYIFRAEKPDGSESREVVFVDRTLNPP